MTSSRCNISKIYTIWYIQVVPQNMQITMDKCVVPIYSWLFAHQHSWDRHVWVCTLGEATRTFQSCALSRSTVFTQERLLLCYIDFGQLGTGWRRSLSSTSAASSRPMSFNITYSLYTVASLFVPQRSRSCWVAVVGHRAKLLITFQGKSNILATFRQLLGGLVGFKKFASFSIISWETSRNIIPFSRIAPPGFLSESSW